MFPCCNLVLIYLHYMVETMEMQWLFRSKQCHTKKLLAKLIVGEFLQLIFQINSVRVANSIMQPIETTKGSISQFLLSLSVCNISNSTITSQNMHTNQLKDSKPEIQRRNSVSTGPHPIYIPNRTFYIQPTSVHCTEGQQIPIPLMWLTESCLSINFILEAFSYFSRK